MKQKFERLRYLREWAVLEEYRQIRRGNYQRLPVSEGAVNVELAPPVNQVENLRRQIEELQREINRIKRSE